MDDRAFSFAWIKATLSLRGFEDGHSTLTMTRDGFVAFIDQLLRGWPFDAGFICRQIQTSRERFSVVKFSQDLSTIAGLAFSRAGFPGLAASAPRVISGPIPISSRSKKGRDWEEPAREHFQHHGFYEGRPV